MAPGGWAPTRACAVGAAGGVGTANAGIGAPHRLFSVAQPADSTFRDSRPRDRAIASANLQIEHDRALNRVVLELLSDHTELFKQFSDNPAFKRWLTDMVFDSTYHPGAAPSAAPSQLHTSA